MPELPDVVVYLEALERRVSDQPLERVRLGSPFVLKSVDPPISAAHGRRVVGLRRLGKRLAVHGRYREPCPRCGAPVQRIRYAENEVNYCAACQTGGRMLADRAFSRLLKEDWPRSLDEWESRFV